MVGSRGASHDTAASAHPKTLSLAPTGPILNANITVNASGNVAASFRGIVTLTSGDGVATLPGAYTFSAADNGQHVFTTPVSLHDILHRFLLHDAGPVRNSKLAIEGEVKVVRNEKNLYWSAAANKGVQAADKNSKYLIFMHCDVVVENPAWIDLLINVSEAQQSGYVGVDTQSYLMGGEKFEFLQEYLILTTREAWEDIGPWPEKLPQVGHSFILTLKAKNFGHKPQIMKNQIVHHYRIFSLDISEFERLTEQAMVTLPRLMTDVQSRPL